MMIRSAFLGRTGYTACWELQRSLLGERKAGRIADTLLFTEHDPVYTIGTGGTDHHLLASDDELERKGVQVVRTDRGGDITYHGPGQLVAYPIFDLHGYTRDLHRYLRDLEEVVIRTLRTYGVEGGRMPEYTGVWVAGEKICAIGIRSSGWVTMHGLALNVSTDLSYFDRIIPCGIFDRGVTSLGAVTGGTFPLEEVARRAAAAFGEVFGRRVEEVPSETLTEMQAVSHS